MMDERDLFEHAARRFDPPTEAFERFTHRRELRHRNQRIRAAVVAVAIVIVGIGSLVWSVRHATKPLPANPPDAFADVHGWIAIGGRSQIIAVNPNDPAQHAVLSDEGGDALSWSSDGSELLVLREDGLHVLHSDGRDTHVVGRTFLRNGGAGGSFSPDGTEVDYGLGLSVYAVDANGGSRRTIASGDDRSGYLPGDVSSAGNLAYVPTGGRGPSYQEIWSMDISDGKGQPLIAASALPKVFGQVPVSDLYPLAWSRDGVRLLFAESSAKSSRPLPNGHTIPNGSVYCALFSVDADGLGVRLVRSPSVCPWSATWSPDGARIAVVQQDGHIVTMSSDGTAVRTLRNFSPRPTLVRNAAWNPVP